MRTKWEILQARLEQKEMELERLTNELHGLQRTTCDLHCGGCGQYLATEADFAKHFLIPDERYLNLGNCPTRDRSIL